MDLPNNSNEHRIFANDYAYQTLFSKIVAIELPPGASISPIELSKELGISRTPIQRACSRLAENGLVNVFPQRGSYVSLINFDKVYESFYLRNLLEQAAVRNVCRLPDRSEIVFSLNQTIYNQRQELDHKNYIRAFDLDNRFHHLIYDAAAMNYIEQALAYIAADQDRIRHLKVLSELRIDSTLEEHFKILNAIENGNADEAARNVYLHISKFAEDMSAIHRKYPKYFSNWTADEDIKIAPVKESFYNFELERGRKE